MSATLVLGHINPDTDTVVSAIAFAMHLKAHGQEAEAVVAGPLNKETKFVLDHFKVEAPRLISNLTAADSVALVDTNNPEELVPGIAEANLVSILDHHKLAGGLSTSGPIEITIKPVACTCTLVLELAGDAAKIPADIAGIMAAAIVSDTLLFTSPTTTPADKDAAERLAAQAGIDLKELADGMFAAKSDLTGLSARDIITMDSKVFPMGDKKVRVSSLETTLPDNALAMKTELVEAMTALKAEEGIDMAFLFIVDIIKSSALLLVPSEVEKSIAEKAFGTQFEGETMELPGVVSRKKQMVPPIEKAVLS